MKTFREHLKEEVKLDSLYTGGIDIERDAVRDEINGILNAVVLKPCVTPYNALNRIRKALAYFSIHLPKRTYMGGKHGIEVWEVHQFGDKIGMTDQGEFVKHVPCKYYLFYHYHLIGSMYFVEAKIVNADELEERMKFAERMVAEGMDAACRQGVAKASAPKEPMHDEDEGTESTKKAVEVSMRRKDKKLSADSLDEASVGKLVAYKNKAGEGREKGLALADKKLKGKAKINATAPKHPYMEETLDEVSKGTAISAYRQKEAEARDTDKLANLIHKKWGRETAKHAYRAGHQDTVGLVRKGESHGTDYLSRAKPSSEMRKTKSGKVHKQDVESKKSEIKFRKTMSKFDKPRGHLPEEQVDMSWHKERMKRLATGNLEEKLTKGMPAGDVISDFVHSKSKTFEGDTKKKRINRALGAYYGMHPEKSRKD